MERTFFVFDLAGFTALTETHGDETAADLIEHRFPGAISNCASLIGRAL
ncbi:MAG: hypothetical protein AB7U76_24135 [Pirellulales bacterium]